ncbi:amidohydrolase [Streptomyces triticagri]|uniref:Amidohydrolase n=1 Tax=Streptomyces triticagri TaxID=2293568 RepID=A0A372M5I1_9ACTN|nr:nitrilase-related carbon-nitrogen hydrolase [Streptomyces triticagri]RFU85713.1 amidohydrolase [Streptomyces triticagri]
MAELPRDGLTSAGPRGGLTSAGPRGGLTSGADESATLSVGLLQTAPVFGALDANLAGIEELRARIGPVDLALTPELSLHGYGFAPHRQEDLLTEDDPRLAALAAAGVGVGFAERSPAGLPWNSYLLSDPQAGTSHLHRKLQPVSYAPWNEHLSFQPGAVLRATTFRGVRIATVICNDMWHPVVPWLAARDGAEVLIVPVASMEGADPARIRRTWEVMLEHAAVLLQCYVVFVNRCGTDGEALFWGGSRVIGPGGDVLTELGGEPDATSAELDLAALRRQRRDVPLLAEGRTDLLPAAGPSSCPATSTNTP